MNPNDAMHLVTSSLDVEEKEHCIRCGNKVINGCVDQCGDVEEECIYDITYGRNKNYTEELRF